MTNPPQGPTSGDEWGAGTPQGGEPGKGQQPPQQPPYQQQPYGGPYEQQSGQTWPGQPYQQPPPGQGYPGQYQQPGAGQPGYGYPGQGRVGGVPPTYLVWSILTTLLCFLPTGIAAIVFSTQVTSKLNAGDLRGAQVSSDRARLWSLISAGIGVFGFLVVLMSGL